MNNSELEKKLKAAHGPALPKNYQEAFPQMVLANLSSNPWKPAAAAHLGPSCLAWGLAAAACVMLAFAVGHWRGREAPATSAGLLENTKLIRETLAMFPNQIRAIVQDERGINLVLSDKEDVPSSPPIYVRICDGKNCSSAVTFSGQEIQIAGQNVTVLSQPDGGIILTGNQFVWSSDGRNYAKTNLKIEAKPLQVGMM
jgi:hypothetical protein